MFQIVDMSDFSLFRVHVEVIHLAPQVDSELRATGLVQQSASVLIDLTTISAKKLVVDSPAGGPGPLLSFTS